MMTEPELRELNAKSLAFTTDQERLREIADVLLKAYFHGFVPRCVSECYHIAYDGLTDKRGFKEPYSKTWDGKPL